MLAVLQRCRRSERVAIKIAGVAQVMSGARVSVALARAFRGC